MSTATVVAPRPNLARLLAGYVEFTKPRIVMLVLVTGAPAVLIAARGMPGAMVAANNPVFRQICQDILSSETSRLGTRNNHLKVKQLVGELVTKHCKRKKTFSLNNFWR